MRRFWSFLTIFEGLCLFMGGFIVFGGGLTLIGGNQWNVSVLCGI